MISSSYSILSTADFVSQQRVISILPDNSNFFWKLCYKRLSKLKISSDFFSFLFLLIIKATSISKNTLVYVSIASQKRFSNYRCL